MNKLPYPGYSPSYKVVDSIGGLNRHCIVVELLTLGELDQLQLASIHERLEAVVASIKQNISIIEKTKLADQTNFDPILRTGLRLS